MEKKKNLDFIEKKIFTYDNNNNQSLNELRGNISKRLSTKLPPYIEKKEDSLKINRNSCDFKNLSINIPRIEKNSNNDFISSLNIFENSNNEINDRSNKLYKILENKVYFNFFSVI